MLLLFNQAGGTVTPPPDPGYTATKRTPLDLVLGGGFRGYKAIPVLILYTTSGSDMLIAQPPAGQSVYLVGLAGSNAAASNLKFKSNQTEILRLSRAANSGSLQGLNAGDPDVLCNTEPGEALNLNVDVALAGPMTAYIIIK